MKRLFFLLLLGCSCAVAGWSAPVHNVVLTWNPSVDGSSNPPLAYNIYKGTAAGGEASTPINATPVAAGCAGPASCTYTDTDVSPGITYYYTVKATLNGGVSAASNEASGTIPFGSPTGLSVRVN